MSAVEKYHAMEECCRRHAELDKTTSSFWLEEAELWSRLRIIERRLQALGKIRQPPVAVNRRPR
jgi:hypothetical protein